VRDLRDWLTDVGFRLRGRLRWSAPARKRPAGELARVLEALSPEAGRRAEELAGKYDLARWPSLLTTRELHEDLHLLDLLDRHVPRTGAPGLEVGSKNGVALPALFAFAPHAWDLVELDAHRRYVDLSTRRAHGERMARAFPGCRYLADSVTAVEGQYGLVVWVLPFVHEAPLRAWGLPRRFFAPEALLRHVLARLAPGAVLFIANQGEAERDVQRDLFATVGVTPTELGSLEGPFSPYRRPRFGFRWVRPA
jgi:hypothetical protein